jgi:alkane 1-monooxygenase
MSALAYFLVFLIPLWAVAGAQLGGLWTFAPVVLAFVLTPAMDALMRGDESNLSEEEESARARNPIFELALLAWFPAHVLLIGWGLYHLLFVPHTLVEMVGITMGVGVSTGGGGINVAHELMHRRSKLHRALAELLMASVSYTHFCIEHVHGHHKRVATPDDPASARLGESFYAFYWRCFKGSFASAWRIEAARCERRGIKPWSLRDRRTRYLLTVVGLYALAGAVGGGLGLAYLAGQSFVAITMLETINYIEHYGLRRRQLPSGGYERVTPHHSWNSTHRITGWYLFNLPRHADHHHVASRPYWKLRHVSDSPQLPQGYATMLVIALVPPLWHRIMDARVCEWNEGKPRDTEAAPLARLAQGT